MNNISPRWFQHRPAVNSIDSRIMITIQQTMVNFLNEKHLESNQIKLNKKYGRAQTKWKH